MEQIDLKPLLGQLEHNVDDLEDALRPLLESSLPEYAAKLPLLDQAKLYVLVTYAIESILFCTCLMQLLPILCIQLTVL